MSVSEFTSLGVLSGRKALFSKGLAGKVELQEAGHPESGSGRCMELRLCQLCVRFGFDPKDDAFNFQKFITLKV